MLNVTVEFGPLSNVTMATTRHVVPVTSPPGLDPPETCSVILLGRSWSWVVT